MYVVSLTSIPPRYATLRPVLDSLLQQRPPPSRVLLHVSSSPREDTLPDGVEVVLVPEDVGPITKVFYVVSNPSIPDECAVLVCDDDCVKPAGWAARLLSQGVPAPSEVVSFATIVSGAYGFAFQKRTLSGVPEFCRRLPPCARRIDDDVLTLYCVLRGLRIRKIARGPVSSVCKELKLPVGGPKLSALAGADARDRLRAQLAAHLAGLSPPVFFDLRPGTQRERTWHSHPSTFGGSARRAPPPARPRRGLRSGPRRCGLSR